MFAVSSTYLAISIAITDFLNGVRGPVPGWYFLAQWYLPTVNSMATLGPKKTYRCCCVYLSGIIVNISIYRSFIKTNLGSSSRRTKVERVLAILVESGALYCFFWTSVIATNCGWIFRTQKTVNDFSPALESDFVTSNILQDVSVHLSGIYSVIIVVLVHLQMTIWDTIYTIEIPLPPLTVASVRSHNIPTSTLTSSDRASAGTAEVPQYAVMPAGIEGLEAKGGSVEGSSGQS
ncbi:uncharacterized protein STEHIDRAFT_107819 [Stereum hirsutum FP-91666 SS1]|uniref:uncharacterized protein n=1 Tax=Stereum hirsutum (strain FP-91666) TaxID=721885 RepID=UPI000440F99D|nr:uncharacterized protein STEHIDRAFT_107819 [Stereum hirsutum FP-91666 SS1]EIM91220.1 hypothetical protein STEHIDRAFT_107819 [Stereum hirsutum FP-91666 SS1]